MSDTADTERDALVVRIAQIIDHPSVFMGGPSRNSMRIAQSIVKECRPDLESAADQIRRDGERIAVMEPAIRAQVENIERWLETGVPATPEESRAIYEALRAEAIASRRASAMPGLGYLRVMEVFDKNETAGSFLREDGEGGFASAVQRMADEISRLTAERDAAIKALCEAARAKGQAEGKLAASEMAGVVEGWKTRAEKAEAERDQALARPAPVKVEAAATDHELLQRAVDLIRGDLVGGEWKKACNKFVKDALRALSAKGGQHE